jgi:RNA polymerase sigma-70 factor (ECF subfamily)
MERAQFEALMRESWPAIRSVARRFDPGPEVDDISQEVVLIAWRRRDALTDVAAFGAWVRAIALNVGRSHARRRETRMGAAYPESARAEDPAAEVLDRQVLGEALATLSKRERLTVEAHHLMGWRLTDIAVAFGEPVGTTKARILRARVKLRGELTRMGWVRNSKDEHRESNQ